MKVLTISFLYSDIQIPIHTSYNMGLLKQTWRFKTFLHAQGFDLCSSSKRYVCITHTFLLIDEQCLLKKLYRRSENDTAKEMHAVTHKKENTKDRKERKKYEKYRICHLYSLQARTGYACLRIWCWCFIVLYLLHIILMLLPYQTQIQHFDSFNGCFSCLTDK